MSRRIEYEGNCYSLYESLLGPFNPFSYIPGGKSLRGNVALGATVALAAGAAYGINLLHSEYQQDMEQRRSDYQEEYEKYQEQMDKKNKLNEKKAAERKANAEKKKQQLEEKKQQQQERAATLQKEREQQRLDKEKEKQNIADAKRKAQLEKEKSPALIDVANFFSLPESDIIAIVQESQATLMRDVQTSGPLAITGGRNPTPANRRIVLRNSSIHQQVSTINAETFSKLSVATRLEIGLWLAYFVRVRYADVTSRGFKRSELIRDNELVLRYLAFTDEEKSTIKRSKLFELYRTILEVAQVIDSIEHLSASYKWLYNNSTLEEFIAQGGATSTEPPNSLRQDPDVRDDETDAKMLYLALPVEDRAKLKTNIDLYNLTGLLPVAAVLGQWDDFRALTHDYLVYSPPGPNSGLEELQRSYSSLPHTPNINALHKMSTVFTPTIEELRDGGVSIPLNVPTITAEMSPDERAAAQAQIDQDTKERFDAFVSGIKHSLSRVQDQSIPVQSTQRNYDSKELDFKEYHIRSVLLEFNQTKSYHSTHASLTNYKSAPTPEPKLYSAGDKRIIVRGAVACIQDLNTTGLTFHFGPHDPSATDKKEYVFVSETFRSVTRSTVVQNQVFVLTQGPEDLYGRSTWTGYFRIIQTPVGQGKDVYQPTFSFFFDVKLECQRVLSPEEVARCDELMAQEAAEKAIREAKAEADAKLAQELAAQQTTDTPAEPTTESTTEAPVQTPSETVESTESTTETTPAEISSETANLNDSVVLVSHSQAQSTVEEAQQSQPEEVVTKDEKESVVVTPEPIVEAAVEEPAAVASEPVVEEAAAPTVEEPVIAEEQPVVEPTPEPIVEKEIEPVQEPASEPVVEEPQGDSNSEPAPGRLVVIEYRIVETLPLVENRVAEVPVVVEEPVIEAPVIAEEPVVETPVVEEPVIAEEPAVETPVVAEEPAVETPVVAEEPAVETPVIAEEPAVETPVVAEEPVIAEEPAVETPVPVEEPEDVFQDLEEPAQETAIEEPVAAEEEKLEEETAE